MAVDGEIVLPYEDILYIDGTEITLAEREIVDGIEQVGLACSVVANKAVNIATQLHIGLTVVLEVV
jgi:hypothetical protein